MTSCGKTGYATFSAAQREMRKILKFNKRHGADRDMPRKAYHCPNCGHYHLSSQTPGSFAGKNELGTLVGQRKVPYKRERVVWEGEE